MTPQQLSILMAANLMNLQAVLGLPVTGHLDAATVAAMNSIVEAADIPPPTRTSQALSDALRVAHVAPLLTWVL